MMTDAAFKVGVVGPLAAGISVLDMALWDLKAKANDEPLWKTLGAAEPRVRAYASGLDMPLSDEQLQGYYEHMATRGVSAGKLKGGANLEDDLRRLDIMREALATSGKPVMLMLDVNEHLTPKQAIRYVHTIEETFNLTWIEEPARRWDSAGPELFEPPLQAGKTFRTLGSSVHYLMSGPSMLCKSGPELPASLVQSSLAIWRMGLSDRSPE